MKEINRLILKILVFVTIFLMVSSATAVSNTEGKTVIKKVDKIEKLKILENFEFGKNDKEYKSSIMSCPFASFIIVIITLPIRMLINLLCNFDQLDTVQKNTDRNSNVILFSFRVVLNLILGNGPFTKNPFKGFLWSKAFEFIIPAFKLIFGLATGKYQWWS